MQEHSRRLDGRVVLITGASSGIGARFARIAAQEGAAVVIGARRIDRLEALRDKISADGGRVLAVELDVTEERSIIAAYDAAEAAFGTVTAIVPNAGTNVEGRALDVDTADFDRLFAINVRGVFLTVREGVSRLRDAELASQGRVVLISSITARMQTSGTVPYSTSKAAVTHMGKVMAREWARSGPNVTILSPGYIRSELTGDWFDTDGGVRQINTWPRRRLLDDDALDSLFVYLLSDESRAVTGAEFVIDDGQSL